MSDQFTKEQIVEYREAFQLFDKNNNGSIDIKELGGILRSLGQTPTDDELKGMIKEADADSNGNIDFQEFLAVMSGLNNKDNTETDIVEAFQVFDKNGDGFIDQQELRSVLASLGQTLTSEELDQMIKEADINGDGKINYKEFAEMMAEN